MNYYQYEATSFVGDINLYLEEGYKSSAKTVMIVVAILAFALTLFTAIAIKRARPYGIIVAIAQPIGIYAAMQMVLSYASIDFSVLEITVSSSISMEDATNKLYDKLSDIFMNDIFPQMLGILLFMAIISVITIMTLVYVAMLFKVRGHGFAIPALIIVIVRMLFLSPINPLAMFGGGAVISQSTWDIVFDLMYVLPLLLIAFQGLVCMLNKKKSP